MHRADYTKGRLEFKSCSPESLVYLPEVLRFYLQHRSRLALAESSCRRERRFRKVVSRLSQEPMLQRVGVRDGLAGVLRTTCAAT